jgi:hypothetical protein
MSDVAESTATAPEASPPPAPEAPTPAKSRQEARQGAHAAGEAYAARLEAAGVEAPRDEDGRFTAVEGAAEAPPEEQAADTAEVSATEPEADQPPDGFVRIEYPEGHLLRETQGITHRDVPVELERDFRAMLNSTTYRRQDVEKANADALEARSRALMLEAEINYMRDPNNTVWTPEHQARYTEMVGVDGYGQEAADLYKAGVMAQGSEGLNKVRLEAQARALDGVWQDRGRRFKAEAHRELAKQYPGLNPAEIDTAIRMYSTELSEMERQAAARGVSPQAWTSQYDYNGQDLIAVAGHYLESRPGVIAAKSGNAQQRELERRQIQADEKARQKAELIKAGQRHATNPHKATGAVDAGQRSIDTTPEAESRVGKTTGQIREAAKSRLRGLGARIAGSQ